MDDDTVPSWPVESMTTGIASAAPVVMPRIPPMSALVCVPCLPSLIVFDSSGDLYLALREGNAIYRVDGKTFTLHHVAGTGEQGYSGDGGPARTARLAGPKGLAWWRNSLYVADTENHVIRSIDLKTGTIRTILGTGQRGDGPESDPLHCALARPHGVLVDTRGVLYVGDSEAHRIRMLMTLQDARVGGGSRH